MALYKWESDREVCTSEIMSFHNIKRNRFTCLNHINNDHHVDHTDSNFKLNLHFCRVLDILLVMKMEQKVFGKSFLPMDYRPPSAERPSSLEIITLAMEWMEILTDTIGHCQKLQLISVYLE